MKYKSTRGGINGVPFIETVMMGLASDGGLMVPEEWPQVDVDTLKSWSKLSYRVQTNSFVEHNDIVTMHIYRTLLLK